MKGHISETLIEDTFLPKSPDKYPDSTLRINCIPHNTPAVFFAKAEGVYKCFKCLVAEQDLMYIDKDYKKQMEDFESIKEYTYKAVLENESHTHLI